MSANTMSLDKTRKNYTLSDFDYALPPELIAQTPADERGASRLLHVDARERGAPRFADLGFSDLPTLLREGDLVVLNDTRVIHARLRGRKPTGGEVEILVERVTGDDTAIVQMRASHLPRPGDVVVLLDRAPANGANTNGAPANGANTNWAPANGVNTNDAHNAQGSRAVVLARDGRFLTLRFDGTGPLHEWLDVHGEVPLPPYITHAPDAADAERYQTVYARVPGAVAAPTAGLHFDAAMLKRLDERGVATAFLTLHVGAGTFQPVTSDDIALHRMHTEHFEIPQATVDAIARARERGGSVLAVGTTTLRALESAADAGESTVRPGPGETALFITPGYRFRVVDRLLTNFHLPKSTLLMLVSAFAGYEAMRAAYRHAVAKRYRFMSYGDCSLLERAGNTAADEPETPP